MILLLTKFLINKEASSCFVFRIGQVFCGGVGCCLSGCLGVCGSFFYLTGFEFLRQGFFHYVALDDLDTSGDQTGLNS